MVALGFMAAGESTVRRERNDEKGNDPGRESETVAGEAAEANARAIFPWNELYASRGSNTLFIARLFIITARCAPLIQPRNAVSGGEAHRIRSGDFQATRF